MLSSTLMSVTVASTKVLAEEGRPQLGVDKEGLLQVCPSNAFSGCTSSQDDRPSFFLAPWSYDGGYELARIKLLSHISAMTGANIIEQDQQSRYVRVEFTNKDASVDDTEFYFTPGDCTIQFRSNRRGNVVSDLGVNRRRIENIRISLKLDSVPVLRNRRRKLIFVESPLDDFGPPTIMFDKVIDGVSGDSYYDKGVIGTDPSAPVWEIPQSSPGLKKLKKN
jgi:uncharacterized protein (DUF1499 family)